MTQRYRITYDVSVTKETFVMANSEADADALAENLLPEDFTTVKNSEDWKYLGASLPKLPHILNYDGKPINKIGYYDSGQYSFNDAYVMQDSIIRWIHAVDFESYAPLARDAIEVVEQALDMVGRKDDGVFVVLTTDNQLLKLENYNLLTD